MPTRQKLELQINLPTEITLLYSDPIVGKSQYGDYSMYVVAVGEEEFAFFAPVELHDQLKDLKKGSKAIITKLAAQRGNKVVTSYEVKVIGKEVKHHITQTTEANIEEEGVPAHDHYYDLLLASYKDSVEISKELNGLVDVHRAAITLYLSRCKQSNY